MTEEAQLPRDGLATSAEQDHVTLSLPASPEFFLLARMNASAIASRLDFGIDEIEDLRLAVDELCILATVGARSTSTMTIMFSWDDSSIEISCDGADLADAPVDKPETEVVGLGQAELARRILDGLVDEHDCEQMGPDVRRARLRMRRHDRGTGG